MCKKINAKSLLISVSILFGVSHYSMASENNTATTNTSATATTPLKSEVADKTSDVAVSNSDGDYDGLVWQTKPTLTEPSKYGNNFKHYDYVNPNAPKGGTLNLIKVGTFDSLNPYIVSGTPPEGLVPLFGGLLYDTLLNQDMDQGGLSYPSIGMALKYPPDYSWAEIKLNPKAKWHDGKPITVEDVIWSFNKLKALSPYYRGYYAMVDHAEAAGPHIVKFVFKIKGDREMPICMGDLVVLPKHWWEGKDKNGKKRDISQPTLEIPLGSSAYKISSFVPGKEIVWERVKDYWAQNLPVNKGRNNYDKIRYTYMRDENAQWEAFKKGGLIDYREEKLEQRWMREYDFPAVKRGDVKRISYPNIYKYSPGLYFNVRRDKFKDIRVRKALTLALDFDSMNRNLFFNKYKRLSHYYNYPVFDYSGPPVGEEKKILEEVRDLVPPEVFGDALKLPSYKTHAQAKANLEEATKLLQSAGYHSEGTRLVDKNGKQLSMEILLSTPLNEQFASFYANSLRKLGINVTVRTVDNAQYVTRRSSYDYDMIYEDVPLSNSPGNEQMGYFGSQLANIKGGQNYAGVANPAIDKLIQILIEGQTRADVVNTTKALDRVLMWNYYRIPAWKTADINIAYWKKMSFPPTQPPYKGFDFLSGWINPSSKDQENSVSDN